jgi:hypothetical protein
MVSILSGVLFCGISKIYSSKLICVVMTATQSEGAVQCCDTNGLLDDVHVIDVQS